MLDFLEKEDFKNLRRFANKTLKDNEIDQSDVCFFAAILVGNVLKIGQEKNIFSSEEVLMLDNTLPLIFKVGNQEL